MKTILLILFFCLSVNAVPPVTHCQLNYDPSAVILLHFNEGAGSTIIDDSGQGNNATLTNTDNWTAAGKFGACYAFDGVDDKGTIADADELDGWNTCTIMAWVKIPSFVAGYRYYFSKCQDIDDHSYASWALGKYYNTAPDKIKFIFVLKTVNGVKFCANYDGDSADWVVYNNWYFVVGTYDGSYMRLYVNGILYTYPDYNPRPQTGAVVATAYDAYLGRMAASYGLCLATVDEAQILGNKVLSQDEIKYLYYRNPKAVIQ